MGNTKTDGLVSDIYGYYSGQGRAVIFIDNDFNGKLSPGDKFEIHPGEADSDLASVADVSDYSFRIRIYVEGEPVQEEESKLPPLDKSDDKEKCVDGGTKTAEDGCNQCVCGNGEWVCTEVDCADTLDSGADEDEEVPREVPSISLIPALVSIGIIALRRRY